MTQPAKQPIVANPATPRDGNTTLNTVVTRPGAKIGKPAREETQADVAVTPAQAILLGQITGEPQKAAAAQTTEACPVSEPGVADPCGVAGAADAHQAAGGLWALAALPLLGLGGGGGGGGGGNSNSNPPFQATIFKATTQPLQVEGNHIKVPVNQNKKGDIFDVDSNLDNSGHKYSIHSIKNAAGDNILNKEWFTIDKDTGELSLTDKGEILSCIGSVITIKIKVEGIDSNNSSYSVISDDITYTLIPPVPEPILNHGFDDNTIYKYPNSDYDVLAIAKEIKNFDIFLVEDDLHVNTELTGSNPLPSATSIIVNHESNPIEYISFGDELTYHGYDFGDAIDYTNYYKIVEFKTNSNLSSNEFSTKSGLGGSDCNDILFNNQQLDAKFFYGGNGNDLIFLGPTDPDSKTPPLLEELTAYGGAGNDLLIGYHGSNSLIGGIGDDVLIGGYGEDTLTGGAGADKFVFNDTINPTDPDTIEDFSLADKDEVLLDKLIFTDLGLVSYNTDTGALSYSGNTFALLDTGLDANAVKNAVFMV